MFDTEDSIDRMTFLECLNDLLSAENTVIERLTKEYWKHLYKIQRGNYNRRLKEQHKQHSRLENLIAYYGGKPTNSKADLVPLDKSVDATTNDMIKKNNNTLNNIHTESTAEEGRDNNMNMTPKEIEILNATEDVIVKNAEILLYKRMLNVSEKIKAKDAINILKQNLKEKQTMFNKIKNIPTKMPIQTGDKNDSNDHSS